LAEKQAQDSGPGNRSKKSRKSPFGLVFDFNGMGHGLETD